jgi:hypothetical protein
MGKAIRGEPGVHDESLADQNKKIKSATLGIAAGIIANGGPHPGNDLEIALVELAEVAGNTSEEIAAAGEEKRPKFNLKPSV